MTNQIRQSINELKNHPWCASTYDLRQLDAGYDAFVQAAEADAHDATIVITRAKHFERLIPKSLHDCPAFVIWLPLMFPFCDYIFDLAYTAPIVSARTSRDLKDRDLVVSWGYRDFSFTSFESAMHPSIQEQQHGGAIPLIFASETRTAITVLPIDSDFLQKLTTEASRCGGNYRPSVEHSADCLKAAAKRVSDPLQLALEFEFDAAGRCVVLLRPRRASRDRLV